MLRGWRRSHHPGSPLPPTRRAREGLTEVYRWPKSTHLTSRPDYRRRAVRGRASRQAAAAPAAALPTRDEHGCRYCRRHAHCTTTAWVFRAVSSHRARTDRLVGPHAGCGLEATTPLMLRCSPSSLAGLLCCCASMLCQEHPDHTHTHTAPVRRPTSSGMVQTNHRSRPPAH